MWEHVGILLSLHWLQSYTSLQAFYLQYKNVKPDVSRISFIDSGQVHWLTNTSLSTVSQRHLACYQLQTGAVVARRSCIEMGPGRLRCIYIPSQWNRFNFHLPFVL